ncbi:MAG: hypothetical protein KBC41_00240 [Candidatus Pacebacteria bacterium]|nr:hypothetical protein [Candidatus Paceibacterota bacterium]MBP9866496.1 hypothetical protein [Candidatus Paceibacterota bacterium]
MEQKQIEHNSISQEEKNILSRKLKQKRLVRIIMSLFSVSIFFFLTTVYSQYQVYRLTRLEEVKESSLTQVPSTPNEIIKAVSKLIILPDTVPQITSIKDIDSLREKEVFFRNALNGDAVIIYETMIIIYRPTTNMIIAVGDIGTVSE